MAYVWSKELETGDSRIDSQHKQLVEAVNTLLDACNSGKGRAELERILGFLADYTVKHFNDEEKLQIQYKYPDYKAHKRMHDEFKSSVGALINQFKTEGSTIVLVGKVNSVIGSWLVNHIKQEDKKIAEHIRGSAG